MLGSLSAGDTENLKGWVLTLKKLLNTVTRKEGRTCWGSVGQEVGGVAGEERTCALTEPGLLGGGECWGGVCARAASPGARTYRDPEGRGPAVIQHGAVVGVLQGILD